MLNISMTRLSSLIIDPTLSPNDPYQGLWIPALTQAQVNAIPTTLTNPLLANEQAAPVIYNSGTGTYQVINRNVWENLVSSTTLVTGVGLVTGSPFVLPHGARAAVEVNTNPNLQNGFMYYDVTNNVIRACMNLNWVTIATGP
jgi:hypothetical protein